MRKLASIEVIDKIEPIQGADFIEKVTVNGWNVVVSKSDKFKVGDKVIFIAEGSLLPPKIEFLFLKDKNYEVKPIKLKKQVSQGLVLPLSYLARDFKVGEDVTNELGITYKYDDKPCSFKEKLLNFPLIKYFYSKFYAENEPIPEKVKQNVYLTHLDENYKDVFETYKKNPFFVTEKLEGCDVTYFDNDLGFGVCSKNIWLRKEDNSCYWEVAHRFGVEEALKVLKKFFGAKNVLIRGTIIGSNIQGNKYKISGYDLYIYEITFDDYTVSPKGLKTFCNRFKFKDTPQITNTYYLPPNISTLKRFAKGKSKINSDVQRKGILLLDRISNTYIKVSANKGV